VEEARCSTPSRALTLSTCRAFVAVVVSQLIPYGAVVSSAPSGWPSRRNCTPATPTSSVAVAVTLTLPDTTAPAGGAVTVALGGDVSGGPVAVLKATMCMTQRLPFCVAVAL
jgi:hypothetical protein